MSEEVGPELVTCTVCGNEKHVRGRSINVAQQGAELLRRGKRIDQLDAEIKKAKAHLVSVIAQRDGFVLQRNDFFAELESQDAEIGRLRESLVNNWDHSWRCKQKLSRQGSFAPPILLEECTCGLADELKQAKEDEHD